MASASSLVGIEFVFASVLTACGARHAPAALPPTDTGISALARALAHGPVRSYVCPTDGSSDDAAYAREGEMDAVAVAADGTVFGSTTHGTVFARTHSAWSALGFAGHVTLARRGDLWGWHGWHGIHEADEGRVYHWSEREHAFRWADVVGELIPIDLINDPGASPLLLPERGTHLFTVRDEAGQLRVSRFGTDFSASPVRMTCGSERGRVIVVGAAPPEPTDAGIVWTSIDAGTSWAQHALPALPRGAACEGDTCIIVTSNKRVYVWTASADSVASLDSDALSAAVPGDFLIERVALANRRLVLAGFTEGHAVSIDVQPLRLTVRDGIGSGTFADHLGRIWLTGPGVYVLREDEAEQAWPPGGRARAESRPAEPRCRVAGSPYNRCRRWSRSLPRLEDAKARSSGAIVAKLGRREGLSRRPLVHRLAKRSRSVRPGDRASAGSDTGARVSLRCRRHQWAGAAGRRACWQRRSRSRAGAWTKPADAIIKSHRRMLMRISMAVHSFVTR
jgi:hypothetical protein